MDLRTDCLRGGGTAMFACYCGSRKGNTELINIKIHPFVLLLMWWSIMDEDVVWWNGPKGCFKEYVE